MADPFEILRLPQTETEAAVDPDPTFAARLRARVERALALPRGVTVSNLIITTPAPALPERRRASVGGHTGGITPYLIVGDGRRALDWYVTALGADRRGEVITMADGRIGHAELELEGSLLYVADESPESHVAAPRPGAEASVSLSLEVADVDRSVERAVAAGGILERPLADNPYGRNAVIRDPFGHRWIISSVSVASPVSSPSTPANTTDTSDNPIQQGDIGYVSLWVPDAEKATAFFSKVLGWSYLPWAHGQTHQVVGRALHHGVHGGHERSSLYLCFVIDDIRAAVERVREAGGEAEEPTDEEQGLTAMCLDVEGTGFSLYQPPAGPRSERLALNGIDQGDVAYITMEVGDSGPVRAFYQAVLGWEFRPGHVEDGWVPEDVAPMTGLSGGHQVTTVVPMYRVDDIQVSVAKVRGAGGMASVPEAQPYGVTSECTDDQGTRFYLGQLPSD